MKVFNILFSTLILLSFGAQAKADPELSRGATFTILTEFSIEPSTGQFAFNYNEPSCYMCLVSERPQIFVSFEILGRERNLRYTIPNNIRAYFSDPESLPTLNGYGRYRFVMPTDLPGVSMIVDTYSSKISILNNHFKGWIFVTPAEPIQIGGQTVGAPKSVPQRNVAPVVDPLLPKHRDPNENG